METAQLSPQGTGYLSLHVRCAYCHNFRAIDSKKAIRTEKEREHPDKCSATGDCMEDRMEGRTYCEKHRQSFSTGK